MKPSGLLSLGSALLVLSSYGCGKNTPGMGTAVGNAKHQAVTTMQQTDSLKVLITDLPPEDIYYGPQLQMHSDSLIELLTMLGIGKAVVEKEHIAEGIDRPYIMVGETVVYPYLDTMGGQFLSKIIDESGTEYIILHAGGSATGAYAIFHNGLAHYLKLLQQGQTVFYDAYEEEEEVFISIE